MMHTKLYFVFSTAPGCYVNNSKGDNLATKLWSQRRKGSVWLNDSQRKAMQLALTRNFQLIQGPPGNSLSIVKVCSQQLQIFKETH